MKRLVSLALCLALLLAGSLANAQTATIVMKAPAGVSQFIDKNGTPNYPDAQGHVNAPVALIDNYLAAGFVYYDIYMLKKAANTDMIFVVTPATLTTPHASEANRTVTITLQSASGEIHTWFNEAITSGVSIAHANNSGTVTATIPSTTLTFVNGVASVTITLGGSPAATDTDTLTVTAATILGFSVATHTSVETFS